MRLPLSVAVLARAFIPSFDTDVRCPSCPTCGFGRGSNIECCCSRVQEPCKAHVLLDGRFPVGGVDKGSEPAETEHRKARCPCHPLIPYCEVCRLHNLQSSVVGLDLTKTECRALAAGRLERFTVPPEKGVYAAPSLRALSAWEGSARSPLDA